MPHNNLYAGGVDDNAAEYWNGLLTRVEAQKIFDAYGEAINQSRDAYAYLQSVIGKVALLTGLLQEKAGISDEELAAYVAKKMSEFKDKVPAVAEEPKSSIILEG